MLDGFSGKHCIQKSFFRVAAPVGRKGVSQIKTLAASVSTANRIVKSSGAAMVAN